MGCLTYVLLRLIDLLYFGFFFFGRVRNLFPSTVVC